MPWAGAVVRQSLTGQVSTDNTVPAGISVAVRKCARAAKLELSFKL